ncbi:GerAB/ArcD/ProY family transporter [Oceanobacillus polygoni]|uniref:Spore germination protein n=1 Tax=Oceanobacillus polygoni TaxID=1235259 RepID=A0A9X0Z2Y7_9BACI|nr:endospore germination permease [Oceanobacillus polygoni]MBP2079891.1 spore germination protein [Oceanobacillus polygoni]PAE28088.1 spore gernimation protein [Paenibacillus sp. 7884-2]
MKSFKYADEKISEKEILIAVPSMVIGVGILSMPKDLASVTIAADGWVPLLIGGLIVVLITWMVAKFASGFANQTFLTYASSITTKPVAIVLTFLFAVLFLLITAFQVRQIADISKQYLFDRTPLEVISLAFLLVVLYAVSGSRAGLFRLNVMFLPIILFIALSVFVFNLGWFDLGNLLPVFKTGFNDYVKGLNTIVTSYLGFSILWFYIALVDKPEKAPKMAALGMCIPVVLYIMLFILCIGVFGREVTANLLYPTVELAKVVDIPGGFLERFESIFFVIWIMAIFNTASMALDVAVLAINSIFKNMKKVKILFILAPVVYIISMFPQEIVEVNSFGAVMSKSMLFYSVFVLVLLFVIAKVRGVKRDE